MRLQHTIHKGDKKLRYTYDGLGRVVKRSFYGEAESEEATFQSEYSYLTGGYGADSTTGMIQSIQQAGSKHEYWYSATGNITQERWQGKAELGGVLSFEEQPVTGEEGEPLTLEAVDARYDTSYTYDAMEQLTRVNDQREQATWTYHYDQGGNILEKKQYAYTIEADLSGQQPEQVISYTYGDLNWKDKLTAYDGKAIAYDEIGNPLAFDGWIYTWKAGRMLHSMVSASTTAEFTYDHTGMRVKKSVNGVDTLYTMNGKKIAHMLKGDVRMHFFYDAQSRPTIVQYNNMDYAYLHNLQGDVTGIVDMSGKVVVQYGYDAWGKPVLTEGSMAGTLGRDNPFRYRGYIYDEETGLYYLRNRYYSSEMGRFVNADERIAMLSMLSQNLFAYCRNSVVSRQDADGKWDRWVVINFHESVTSQMQMFLESPDDYRYKEDFGYQELRGNTPGEICCAYLMYVIEGEIGSTGSNTRYKRAKKAGLTGDIQEIIDAVNAGAPLEDFAGLDVYQVNKNGVAGHVGRLVIHDFGDGEELAVFQSVKGSVKDTKALFPDDGEYGGPNITALIQYDGTTRWTHYGEVEFKRITTRRTPTIGSRRGGGRKPVVKGKANTNWLCG